ncbi:MAG: hypothetical protein KatS3mg004_3701 [Bryobacteraceae bacterium]|nr:MAG: hypothetical protein KatS3mg004_3701 [Bryobacteraceae bacterium]
MANPKYAEATRPIPQAVEVGTLSDGTKIMKRAPRIRSCGLKDEKGKLCAGHLKRWYFYDGEVLERFGPNAEIYRCEKCKAIYLPNEEEEPRTGTLCW